MSKKKSTGRPYVGKDATRLGENLRYIRRSVGMTQDSFSGLFGIERATYQTYEVGNNHPNPVRLIEMSKRMNLSIDTLLKVPMRELPKKFESMLSEFASTVNGKK